METRPGHSLLSRRLRPAAAPRIPSPYQLIPKFPGPTCTARPPNHRLVTSICQSPQQLSLIYTYHRPARDLPKRSRSWRAARKAGGSAYRKSRPESLSSSLPLNSLLSPATTQPHSLLHNPSRSQLVVPVSSEVLAESAVSQFAKTVFPLYDQLGLTQMLPAGETAEEALKFIQEVQPGLEQSDDEAISDSICKGTGCTEDEFKVSATATVRSKGSRTPYKDLSLVGLMPLEELLDQVPYPKDRRDRAKTYTGAGGFTVQIRKNLLVPEVEYGFVARPKTQLLPSRRPKSMDMRRIDRPQSSTGGMRENSL